MQTELHTEEDPETVPEEKTGPLSEAEKEETLRRSEEHTSELKSR